ncbi:WD40 repeat domain-containing protein [Plantactinospora sp. BB1]|uniref:WD40 repeat domain-containing protein n=1 Tax=Plantactinospora sp. BB1 TaxID=2071627 RepID=UPI000D17E476|nr:hypothetical protein [Plantactinospora sp. BB1]AVT39998.1 hypothetical protein C6W10_30155 [Plantactinospora sp. BB1]
MSERADRLLREAVHELAGSPHQPPDFAAAAVVQGRRMRRRRQTIAAAASVVAVAAIVAPYVWLRPDPQPPGLAVGGPPATTTPAAATTSPPTPQPTPSGDWHDGPVELPGGALLLSARPAGSKGPTWAYDTNRRRYVSVPETYTSVRVSPRHPVAAVRHSGRSTEIGLYDLATGKPQWFETGATVAGVEWSPDGRRLLVSLRDKKGVASIGLFVLGEGTLQFHPVKARPVSCAGLCRFTWTPNGREVAVSQADPVVNPPGAATSSRPGLQFFAADDGMPTRSAPVHGDVASSGAWSPDGALVVVSGEPGPAGRGNPILSGGEQVTGQLVSVQTGKVVRRLPTADVTWLTADRLLYVDGMARSGRLTAVLLDPAGVEHERVDLPAELGRSDEITVAVR